MYRPLPDCLTIKESEIEGLGLFATEDIPAGTELGVSHHKIFMTENNNPTIIRTPLGGFYNHSNNPNSCREEVAFTETQNELSLLITTRDIKAGEEITVKYTLYNLE